MEREYGFLDITMDEGVTVQQLDVTRSKRGTDAEFWLFHALKVQDFVGVHDFLSRRRRHLQEHKYDGKFQKGKELYERDHSTEG